MNQYIVDHLVMAPANNRGNDTTLHLPLETPDADIRAEINKIFGPLPGRWDIANEGEDAEGVINYVRWEYTSCLFLATFTSYQYPEDNKVVGVFSTKDLAQAAIRDEIDLDKHCHPGYSARYQQNESYYNINEVFLDERNI